MRVWREEQMGFFMARWILPQVIELTMRQKNFCPVSGAHGRRCARPSSRDWDRLGSQPRIISPGYRNRVWS